MKRERKEKHGDVTQQEFLTSIHKQQTEETKSAPAQALMVVDWSAPVAQLAQVKRTFVQKSYDSIFVHRKQK
jgi:hypothetical protein